MKSLIALLAACLLIPGLSADASIGKTWTAAGSEQFSKGDLDGVSVLSTGELQLAPEAQEIEGLEAEFVWDVETAEDGTIYAAVGSPAAVYTVKAGRAELLHKSEQKQALCVLPMPDGAVLVGTAPEGIIYRIDRRGGASTFADLEDSYVWDMALGPFNRIYCATGPNGRLLELNRAGEVTERLKTKQKNLMCVAVDKEATVYVGTEPDGYIYRVPREGKTSLLYDADESEIHDLALDDEGRLYACTAQSKGPRPSGPRPPDPSGENSPPAGPRSGPPGAPNSVYRIVPGEGAERIAGFPNLFLQSLSVVGGRVLAGTGPGGRVMSVDQDGGPVGILTEFDADNVTAMAVAPSGDVIVGTSKAGSLWRLGSEPRESGTFISETFNAGYLSRWGRARWRQKTETGQSIRIKLRTGNSSKPDEHWSEWSDWATDPAGELLEAPMGRFAQFSAELKTRPRTGSPSLIEVSISYRQVNRRPAIQDLTADGSSLLNEQDNSGASSQARRPPGAPAGPARPGRGKTTEKQIAWKAADPNGDKLVFDLYYRGIDEQQWKEIEKDVSDSTSHKWDTARVPDGYYLLKLVARDDAVRPGQEALSHERISWPLLIDNRPPAVAELKARRRQDGSYELTGMAVDEHSGITGIEVSHNSGDWQPVFPTDGILDSREEAFSYRTEVLEPGEHVFAFATQDKGANTGSGKLTVTVK